MLMGIARLNLPRVCVASFASAFMWTLSLSLVGKVAMTVPFFIEHSELLTQLLLISSLVLFVCAILTIAIRWFRGGVSRNIS
jgi:membrane protein DedA with SNARE-associated domain